MRLVNKCKHSLLALLLVAFSGHAAIIPFIAPVAGTIDTSDILATETYDYTSPIENYYYDFYLDVFNFTNSTGQDRLLTFTVTPDLGSNLNPWLAVFEGTDTVPLSDHSWAAYIDDLAIQPDFYDIMGGSVAGTGPGSVSEIQYFLGAGDSMQLVVTTTEYYQIIVNGLYEEGPNENIFGDYVLTATYEVSEPNSLPLVMLMAITLCLVRCYESKYRFTSYRNIK